MEQLPKVFPLKCAVQKYLWGKIGHDSEVAQLSLSADPSFEVDENSTYAELWMGTHPNGPSRIISSSGDADIDLGAWVQKNADSIGTEMEKNKNLSFLFKVLSVKTALSIQAHPNKVLAELIHKEKPELYKDPNHKPEMAIALTPFKGLCGFRPIKEVAGYLKYIEEFRTAVGGQYAVKLLTASKCMDQKLHIEAMKDCFSGLMNQKKDVIHAQLSSLINHVTELEKEGKDTSQYEADVLLKVNREFPGDVGCFAIYFLNVVNLNPGEAMFLRASLPHAYLSGDCIECMACSDNTIRAGLTPKHRDVNLLCEMLDYNSLSVAKTKFRPIQRGNVTYYKPDIEDFMVTKVEVPADSTSGVLHSIDSASICIVIQGEGQASSCSLVSALDLSKGSVFFIAANEEVHLTVSSQGMVVYRASYSVKIPSA
ncbi:mannose-6-phosphate isomerase-like [Pecten maximus]|uniref:mannose-6-phosphate isomerase-like n=1 Tax=Pecten maximus TaxID=6579 RepID=UPI0014583AD6|nr:mannose-6-phosphate isomerase-like [Pecten maximus]